MPQRILLLGAGGFIGKSVQKLLQSEYEVLVLNRNSKYLDLEIESSNPDIVINCSASRADANFLDSIEANLHYQMKCLDLISKTRQTPFKWVQIGSYFELQIISGRSDYYSKHKELCRAILADAHREGLINLTTIFLPHVFGEGENPKRLSPYLRQQFKKGEVANISSGIQFLPLLSLQDATTAIIKAIETDQLVCSATPIWYGQITELVSIIKERFRSDLLTLNPKTVSVDAEFSKVTFPPAVMGWEPKMQLEDFLTSLGLAKD